MVGETVRGKLTSPGFERLQGAVGVKEPNSFGRPWLSTLQVLERVGLVRRVRKGRETLLEFDVTPIETMTQYLEEAHYDSAPSTFSEP